MACADHHDIELSMREFLDAPCIKELRRSSCAAWLQEVFSVVVWLRTTLGSFCQVTDMQLTRWWGKLVCFTGTQGRLRVGALLRSLGRTLSAMNSQSGVPEIDRPQTTDTFFDLFLHCPIFFGFSLPQKTSVIWLRNRRKKQSRLWQELRRRQWVYAAPARSLFFVNRAGISVGQIGSMAVSSEM